MVNFLKVFKINNTRDEIRDIKHTSNNPCAHTANQRVSHREICVIVLIVKYTNIPKRRSIEFNIFCQNN